MSKKHFILTITAAFIVQLCFAQNFDKTKLDNYFKALDQNEKFMGSVAVSHNGEIIYSNTIGFSDFENSVKANEKTKYRIGSISKTFTAVLVMKAVEQNKLTLSHTLSQFFPEIINSDKITISHLLSHRSGIFNFTDNPSYYTWNTQPKTQQEMIQVIIEGGSVFEPGSKAQYSNSNYVLLTFILQDVFGKSYNQLLKEYITEPLDLNNTFLGGKIDVNSNESRAYRFLKEWEAETETDASVSMGAGALVSTPSDLVKFAGALFNEKLVNKETLAQMTSINDNFGYGLFITPFYVHRGYGHTGGIDGFTSIFCHFPESNISYSLVCNGLNYNQNLVSIAVLSAIFNKPYDIPDFTTYKLTAEELQSYAGTYSSAQLPIKITITVQNGTLVAQATGQPALILTASEKDKFIYEAAGIVMEFNVQENSMVLKQSGGSFLFTKEQ